MLDELKNLKYLGGKEGLLFFIRDIIGGNQVRIQDAQIICNHTPGKNNLSVSDLVCYCSMFDWIQIFGDTLLLSPNISKFLRDGEKLNETLIITTVKKLFEINVFNANMFSYDSVKNCYVFKNELLPLSFSCVRNLLISQGFLIPLRGINSTQLFINCSYDIFIAKYCKEQRKKINFEELKKQLESNEKAGEKAELFVVEYEKKRLGFSLGKKVKRISEIDVTAGYDIVSFDTNLSQEPDRFIEVKAISNKGFFWTRNEIEIAKLKGNNYYLYLIDLNKISQTCYLPQIIKNPVVNIMESEEWFAETQSYFIKRL